MPRSIVTTPLKLLPLIFTLLAGVLRAPDAAFAQARFAPAIGQSDWAGIVAAAAIVAGSIAAAVAFAAQKYSLVTVSLALRNGRRYASRFERLASIQEGSDRDCAHALFAAIADGDIAAGFVALGGTARSPNALSQSAAALWARQMRGAGIEPDTLSVAGTAARYAVALGGGSTEAFDWTEVDQRDSFCVVCILVTAGMSGRKLFSTSDRGETMAAIHALAASRIDALFYTYTPSPGEPAMSAAEATIVINRLQAASTVTPPTSRIG